MPRYRITIENNKTLITMKLTAISQTAAEMKALEQAVNILDPHGILWPSPINTMKITNIVQETKK